MPAGPSTRSRVGGASAKRALLAVALLASALALSPPASSVCVPNTSICLPPYNPGGCNGDVYYLSPSDYFHAYGYWDDRDLDGVFLNNDWLYDERNGQPGLQSGGSLGPVQDPCDPPGLSDRLVGFGRVVIMFEGPP